MAPRCRSDSRNAPSDVKYGLRSSDVRSVRHSSFSSSSRLLGGGPPCASTLHRRGGTQAVGVTGASRSCAVHGRSLSLQTIPSCSRPPHRPVSPLAQHCSALTHRPSASASPGRLGSWIPSPPASSARVLRDFSPSFALLDAGVPKNACSVGCAMQRGFQGNLGERCSRAPAHQAGMRQAVQLLLCPRHGHAPSICQTG